MLPPLHKSENMVERKVAATTTPGSVPLLAAASSSNARPSSSLPPPRSYAFLVNLATTSLWAVFKLIDGCLSANAFVWNVLTAHRRRRQSLGRPTATVVVVGGNFAGLSALWQLLAWQRKHPDVALDIILIDKRDYSEYIPGILRLFCEPSGFWDLAQSLPGGSDGVERIKGTVISLVGGGDPSPRGGHGTNKVLTYVPAQPSGGERDATETSAPTTKSLRYDYLILATGATYNEPISPATAKVALGPPTTTNRGTLHDRYREWQKAHERVQGARSVLILGGGAVGVELAAEILDHDDKEKVVTIVNAHPTLVPLFSASVGAYAEDWLSRKGAKVVLGERLRSWNDRSCTLADGTVLHADVVYVCFGNRPNSEMVATGPVTVEATAPGEEMKTESSSSSEMKTKTLFSLTRRRNVVVKDTLQLVIDNDTGGDGGESSDACWFACGDVASPPTNDEKQAFQAEMQGKLAARNVIAMLESSTRGGRPTKPNLFRYPEDVAGGSDRIPLVFVLSLGRYDGVLGFNSLCIPGPVAAIVKWILEHTKVSQMRGRLLGHLVWKIGDAVTLFLSRTLFKPSSPPSQAAAAGLTARTKAQ